MVDVVVLGAAVGVALALVALLVWMKTTVVRVQAWLPAGACSRAVPPLPHSIPYPPTFSCT